jgi:hypothetical protein
MVSVLSAAYSIKNYFIQPGSNGDNALYINGTLNASNASSISMNSVEVSTITVTNSISVSTITATGTINCKVIDYAVNLDTTTAPSSTGIVGLTSGFKMYVSTGTAAGSWQLVGSQS